jgi:hypothetical protein
MGQGRVKSGVFEAGSECRVLSSELQHWCTYFWRDGQRTLFILSPKLTKHEEKPPGTGFPTRKPTFRRSSLPSLPAEVQETIFRSGPTPRTNFFPSESIFN